MLKFIKPSANSFLSSHNSKGIKLITRLRLGRSHLQEHRFKNKFQDSLNLFSNFCLDIESTVHYLLYCPRYITERRTLLSTIENIHNNLLDLCNPVLGKTLLFERNWFDANANINVVNATIEYTLSTKRFKELLFQWSQKMFKQGFFESVNSVSNVIVTCLFLLLFVDFYSYFLLIIFYFQVHYFTVFHIIHIYRKVCIEICYMIKLL